MGYFSKLVDFVLPPRCIVTGDIVDQQGMIAAKAWVDLRFISNPQCLVCGVPFEYLEEYDNAAYQENAVTCVSCLKEPPAYKRARASLVYDDASRALVLPFKHGDKTHYILGFLPWLKKAGGGLINQADILMPVPLHPIRLFQRRYNQAGIMTHYLAKECDKACLLDGLIRVRSTPTQGHMQAKDRTKNVHRAFAVQPRYRNRIKGKNILLIDDVLTTGATVNECTRVLLKAGAKSVDALTLTRVVKAGAG